jgi:hypothetical protein
MFGVTTCCFDNIGAVYNIIFLTFLFFFPISCIVSVRRNRECRCYLFPRALFPSPCWLEKKRSALSKCRALSLFCCAQEHIFRIYATSDDFAWIIPTFYSASTQRRYFTLQGRRKVQSPGQNLTLLLSELVFCKSTHYSLGRLLHSNTLRDYNLQHMSQHPSALNKSWKKHRLDGVCKLRTAKKDITLHKLGIVILYGQVLCEVTPCAHQQRRSFTALFFSKWYVTWFLEVSVLLSRTDFAKQTNWKGIYSLFVILCFIGVFLLHKRNLSGSYCWDSPVVLHLKWSTISSFFWVSLHLDSEVFGDVSHFSTTRRHLRLVLIFLVQ